MHKCFKCGAEFEGKFCPECGTQWQENKHCPNCGAMLAGGAKFCNNCGYSFVGKKEPSKVGAFFKKVWLWIKRHAKVVIPTACALIVVIVVCSLIPTFILMGVNGTYYGYTFDENGKMVFNEKNFVTLSTGKWTDSDGNEGTYSRSGSSVTLKYHDQAAEDFGDMFGEEVPTEVELAATVENGLLIISNGVREEIYAKQSHEHKFGEWEVTKEPTCTVEGEQRKICVCKKTEREAIAIIPHNYQWTVTKEVTCTEEGEQKLMCSMCKDTQDSKILSPKGHDLNDDYFCVACGTQFTKGLKYELLYDSSGYTVTGIGTASGDIVILNYYEGKPVKSIGDDAFRGCSGLTSITIPNSVTSIGKGAFYGCSKLIQTEGEVRYVDKWVVGYDESVTSVTLRSDSVGIADFAFHDCSSLTSITIPDSVKHIGDRAFNTCSKLTSVIIGNGVTSIGNGAFYGCSKLIQTEGGVRYVDKWVVGYDESVTSVTLRSDSVGIADFAFNHCSGLTSITIPDSVTIIGEWAFAYCGSLTSVKIGNGVTSIGNGAFAYCGSLTSIIYHGTKAQWKAIEKESDWNGGTRNYTVQCTDGKLDKNGNEVE